MQYGIVLCGTMASVHRKHALLISTPYELIDDDDDDDCD